MDKEQVLEVKELIKYGFSLESIATGFKIPIEEVEKLKRQIEEEKQQILKREKYLTIGPKCLGKHCEYKKTTMCKFCKVCMKEV